MRLMQRAQKNIFDTLPVHAVKKLLAIVEDLNTRDYSTVIQMVDVKGFAETVYNEFALSFSDLWHSDHSA